MAPSIRVLRPETGYRVVFKCWMRWILVLQLSYPPAVLGRVGFR